ncbi:MAG: hypothetical protein V4659_04240 [Pseudomonadota bacterium]
MTTLFKKAVLGATLAASALTVAAPAEAQRYYRRHNDRGSTALVAGVAGLAIGAALASSANDRYRDGYYRDRGYRYDYDDYYYRQRGYYPADGYYAYRYRDYNRCYTERRYDPYYGRRVKVRVCN